MNIFPMSDPAVNTLAEMSVSPPSPDSDRGGNEFLCEDRESSGEDHCDR